MTTIVQIVENQIVAVVGAGESLGLISAAGATQLTAVDAAGATQIGLVTAEGSTQIANIANAVAAIDFPSNANALSNGVASVAITAAGSGGTTGTYTWTTTGGAGTNASGFLTVAGGAITSVVVLQRGYSYTSAPTIVIAGSHGVTGHTLTPSIAINRPVGSFWRIKITNGWEVYENVAGTATLRGAYSDKTIVDATISAVSPFMPAVTLAGTARERVKRLQMANVLSTGVYFLRNIGYTATPQAYMSIAQDMSGVATVLSLGTGTGGTGTYIVSSGTICTSTTLTIGSAVVTGSIALASGVSTLTVTAVTSGTVIVGATISGSSIYKDVAGLNTNGTNLGVSGLSGVNNFPLFPINASGIVGTVAIDLGSGATWSLPSNNLSSAGQFDPNKTIVATVPWVSEYDARWAAAMTASRAEGQTVFLPSATDSYARRLVKEMYIEGGEGDSYLLNYETQTLSGPLYRIQFFLRSVALGATVASWSKQNADLPTLIASLPESVKLAQVVNGDKQTGYAGVEATLFPTWSALEMNKALTSYTTTAATGINPACIVSNSQMDDFLVSPRPKGVIYVGPSETYTTVADAVASLRNGATPFSRSTYPNSDVCTYSNQKLIQVPATHNETIVSFTVSGNANGLLLPHYSTLHLPEGAKLSMNGADTAPVLEANHSCRIRGGGEIEQLGNGYGIHIDGVNNLSVFGASKFLRYRDRHVIENITIRHSGTTSTAAMIGMGISDGQTLICRGVRFIRVGTGTAPLVIIHTSPGCVVPGTVIFENCYFNDALISGSKGMELLKSHSQTVQHKLIVNGTQIDEISASTSVGGASAWVRQGWFDPRITYSSILDPA